MKFLGVTDEVTSCDCCGRVNLKCTVAFERNSGDVVFFGRVCASKNTGKPLARWQAEHKTKLAEAQREARARVWQSPENQALEAKFKEADKLQVFGKARREFTRAEDDVFRAARDRLTAETMAEFGLSKAL